MQLVGKTFKADLPSGEKVVIHITKRVLRDGRYFLRFSKNGGSATHLTTIADMTSAVMNSGAAVALNRYQALEWQRGIFHPSAVWSHADHNARLRQTLSAILQSTI